MAPFAVRLFAGKMLRRIVIFMAAVLLLAMAAAGATYARYESLSPCDWLVHDMAVESGLPLVMVRGQVAGSFLIEGITDPTPYQCLLEWWAFRRDDSPHGVRG